MMTIERCRIMATQWDECRGPQPGTELKKILATFQVEPGACGCNRMLAQMNRWGADCGRHTAAIAAHLEHEARARGWKLPAMRFGARQLVRLAIFRARLSHKKK